MPRTILLLANPCSIGRWLCFFAAKKEKSAWGYQTDLKKKYDKFRKIDNQSLQKMGF